MSCDAAGVIPPSMADTGNDKGRRQIPMTNGLQHVVSLGKMMKLNQTMRIDGGLQEMVILPN